MRATLLSIGAILYLFSNLSFGSYENPYASISFAQKVKEATFEALHECGLESLSAYDPRLPYPQVPAQLAIVNSRGALLAYFYEDPFGFVFKSPNGGNTHTASIGDGDIQFTTPYLGNVAHVNRWKTVAGWGFTYHCRSQPVTYPVFEACVQRFYIDVIAAQLCRFE